jgi:CheY-like chemotaxis protein
MLKVLIVDDEDGSIEILALLLTQMNFLVIQARDGMEALERIQKEHPDIVVSDYRMPRLNGIYLYRRIKKSPTFFYLPFILVSGPPPADVHSDVPVFLLKPFNVSDLVTKINELTMA